MTTAGETKNSRQLSKCHTISLTEPLTTPRVDAFSPSSSESSLVSPIQTSIHDNDLSSNSESKEKRGRKGIINEKQWRSDEIMQLISMWKQKEELYNAASPDYSVREKR